MPKVTNLRNLVKAAIGVLTVLPVCASCVYDSYMDAPDDNATTVNVGLTFRTGSVTGDVEGFVQGSDYENYIDIEGGDYRIYFFTNSGGNDTFLARFEPSSVVANDDYTEYTLYGTVRDGVVSEEGGTSFKIMVLANWGTSNYDDDALGTNTTIDDVCEAEWSKFSAITSADDFVLSEENLIPFFGIHAYSGITFKKGEAVELSSEPITLLRAMAKVEVELETEGVAFSDVTIQHYNATGYCAPADVYSEDDYDWYNDYHADVHLVNDGANDTEATSRSMSFKRVQEADTDSEIYETWVAYLPEYDNTSSDDDYSYIVVTVAESGDTHEIYFANYTDGKTDNAMENRFDIQRNNLYHYEVKVSATGTKAANKKLSMTEWNIFMRR